MPPRHLKIGELAARAGVRVDTVRYYERRKLLPKATRASSGYRTFSEADVERLLFTKQAQALGFTLDEIIAILASMDLGEVDYARAAKRVERVIARVDDKLAELRAMRKQLARLLRRYSTGGCKDLERAADGMRRRLE